ncbi:hypothetical protein ACJX0J_039339, partial [Zea mays]
RKPFREPALPAAAGHHGGERAAPRPGHPCPRGRHCGRPPRQPVALQHHNPLARHIPARHAVGGRPGDGDAVSGQAGRQLHVPLQRDGAGGDAVVARPHLLPPRHRVRRAGPPPPRRRRRLPVPQAARRGDRRPRRVVERQRLRPPADGVPHRAPGAQRRRVHHQRQAWRPVQLLRREPDVPVPGAEQRDVPAADHQRRAQHAPVLQGGEPQLHRGGRR